MVRKALKMLGKTGLTSFHFNALRCASYRRWCIFLEDWKKLKEEIAFVIKLKSRVDLLDFLF